MTYSSASYDFSGNVAVVTGGAQGIGASVVERLRAEGATVVVWDLPQFAPAADEGLFHAADVSEREGIERATEALIARWGRIDYLVNNAGFAGSTVALLSLIHI